MATGDRVPPLSVRRRRVMCFFVEAAQRTIQDKGLEQTTIRGVAAAAGYNSATLYRYFGNLEHLILFGSVCYLRDYVLSLSRSLKPGMNALERYRTIYRCFNEIAFQYPDIFHNMFFGRYCNLLGDVLQIYYGDLFPEELDDVQPFLRKMLMAGTMEERDSGPIRDLVEEGFLDPGKARYTKELVIALHQHYLHEAALHFMEINMDLHLQHFNLLFDYLLEQGSPRTQSPSP